MNNHITQIFRFQSLVGALVTRQLASRYRGSALGFVWSLLNPLLFMAVYTLVFHYYVRVTTLEHYAVYVFCGLLPWTWLTTSIGEGTSSVVSSGHLITKSLFPPQVLPLVSVLSNGCNFILALPVFIVIALASGHAPPLTMLFIPVLLAIQFVFLYGIVLLFSAVNVLLRDVQHLVGHVLMVLFFLCPILYTDSTVPERLRWTLDVNPCAAFIRGYQSILFYGELPSLAIITTQIVWSAVAFVVGAYVFERLRERFAELL